jgi:hypothetical protein
MLEGKTVRELAEELDPDFPDGFANMVH